MTGSVLLFAQLPINPPIGLTNSLEIPFVAREISSGEVAGMPNLRKTCSARTLSCYSHQRDIAFLGEPAVHAHCPPHALVRQHLYWSSAFNQPTSKPGTMNSSVYPTFIVQDRERRCGDLHAKKDPIVRKNARGEAKSRPGQCKARQRKITATLTSSATSALSILNLIVPGVNPFLDSCVGGDDVIWSSSINGLYALRKKQPDESEIIRRIPTVFLLTARVRLSAMHLRPA